MKSDTAIKKICIISKTAYEYSGIGRTVLSTAREFEKKGYAVGFVTESGDCSGEVLFTQFNARSPLIAFKNFFKVVCFVRRYDAILCYDVLPAGFFAAGASFIARKPLYLHCIGTYSLFSPTSQLKNFCMRLVHFRSKKTFVLSHPVKKYIEKSLPGFLFKDPTIVPPGVYTDFFSHVTEVSDLVNGQYIITVGAVKSRKGHDLSLEAFAKISSLHPKLQYVIVGDNDRTLGFAAKLDSIIKKYNIENKVIFLERISDEELRKLYSHADFFIMTSRTTPDFIEGFGIVYLEAGLCGAPSIGARETGAEDAIIDGTTGFLVDQNVDAIASGMERLLQDTAARTTLGENARRNAQEYTWEKIAAHYLSYMQS